MKTPALVAIIVVIACVASAQFHMIYSADRIANDFGGYVVSLGFLPILFGGSTGLLGAIVNGQGVKKVWWLPVLGAIASLVPVAFVSWVMSQPTL
jgi:hypothetical protein